MNPVKARNPSRDRQNQLPIHHACAAPLSDNVVELGVGSVETMQEKAKTPASWSLLTGCVLRSETTPTDHPFLFVRVAKNSLKA
jgi:hypothetical protein